MEIKFHTTTPLVMDLINGGFVNTPEEEYEDFVVEEEEGKGGEEEENKEEEVEAEEIYFADTTSAAGLDMLQALWYCHICFFKSLHILGSLRRCFIVEKC